LAVSPLLTGILQTIELISSVKKILQGLNAAEATARAFEHK
jgi:hypothetical protein